MSWPVKFWKVPTGQASQDVAPREEVNCPTKQGAQAAVRPVEDENFPASQREHMTWPVKFWKVPTGQASQVEAPGEEVNFPAEHGAHSEDPGLDSYVPFAQGEQDNDPEKENMPASQSEQLVVPITAVYFPA